MREAARADVERHHGTRTKLDCACGAGRGPRSRLAGEVDDGPVLHRDGIEAVSNRREGAEHLEIGRARVGCARVARHVVRDGNRLRQVNCARDVVRRVVRGRNRFIGDLKHTIAFELDSAVGSRPATAVPCLVRRYRGVERVAIQDERAGDVRGARHVYVGICAEVNRAVGTPFWILRHARVRERAAVDVHLVQVKVVDALVVEGAARLDRYGRAVCAEHGTFCLSVVIFVLRTLAVVGDEHQSFMDGRAAGVLV